MLVGVDVGGTKTHVVRDDGASLRHDVVPTRAWQRTSLFDARDVAALVDMARAGGGDDPDDVMVIGAHGCDAPHQIERLTSQVRRHWSGRLLVVNDAELLAPACGLDDAICVVVGTGSIVVGRTADGSLVQVGGHGWMLDDFGSAPGLAREAVRAVACATDTRTPRDGLAELLMERLEVSSEVDLVHRFTTDADIVGWARMAPLVFAAAAAGSALAAKVVAEAAGRLAAQVALAHRHGAVGDTVVTAGGIVVNQPRLVAELEAAIGRLGLPLTLRLLDDPPVLGALELARRVLGPGDPFRPSSPATKES